MSVDPLDIRIFIESIHIFHGECHVTDVVDFTKIVVHCLRNSKNSSATSLVLALDIYFCNEKIWDSLWRVLE